MQNATMSLADILKYRNDLVRTQKVETLGKMQKIAIGPNALWNPRTQDATMQKIGRFIELRDQPLPIAQSLDRSSLLVMAPLLHKVTGRVELPNIPDPNWTPGQPTREEIEGIEVEKEIKDLEGRVVGTRKVRVLPQVDNARRIAPMVPQDLVARAEGILEGTNFLVFSPVEKITFQPELNRRMVGDAWVIDCSRPDPDGRRMALIVDRSTGETHFFGGCYEIVGNDQR